MSTNYSSFLTSTPATEQARADQVANQGGGFAFAITPLQQLRRFLILGAEGPTYYASERKQVMGAVRCLDECVTLCPEDAIRLIVEVSDQGLAPKNDPAVFALAYVAKHAKSDSVRAAAYRALPKVCRIGTHLFQFAEHINAMGGWGAGARRAVGRWYTERKTSDLAHQVVKYQQRNGWSHRDLLRLSHVNPSKLSDDMADILQYVAKPDTIDFATTEGRDYGDMRIIHGFERAKRATSAGEVANLIDDFKLPRECVPTQFLNDAVVWEALLPHMSLTALTRNLAKLTSVGVLAPLSPRAKLVADRLTNVDLLRKGRVHPIQMLSARIVYGRGYSERGSQTFAPVPMIVDALDRGFYAAFRTLEPTGKAFMLGVDVSGSMGGGEIAGVPGLTPRMGAACMAMAVARTEPNYHIMGFARDIVDLGITASDTLNVAMAKAQRANFGSTNIGALVQYAADKRIKADCFVTITDNEVNQGRHPFQVLRGYRKRVNASARSVMIGMTATQLSVADPSDTLSLDIVGFDASGPALISAFAAGNV